MVPGLHKAPVTKALLALGIATTVLGLSNRLRGQLDISNAAAVLQGGQWWRLFTSLLPSDSFAEGLVAWLLLYWFRGFERQMGSGKFALFALLAGAWAVVTRAGLLAVPGLGGLSSGPYELLFGLFVYYHRFVPRLVPAYVSLWRLKLSDKAITYAVGLQLLLNNGARSGVLGLSGLLFGALFLADVGRISSRLRLPALLRACCRRYVLPWWESDSPHALEQRAAAAREARERRERALEEVEMAAAMATIAAMNGGGRRGAAAAGGAAPRGAAAAATGGAGTGPGAAAAGGGGGEAPVMLDASQVDAGAVDRLVAMGFGRDQAVQALRRTFNNEAAAADRLLS